MVVVESAIESDEDEGGCSQSRGAIKNLLNPTSRGMEMQDELKKKIIAVEEISTVAASPFTGTGAVLPVGWSIFG